MASMMGLQQQAASQDTVDYAGYLQSTQCNQIHEQNDGKVQLSQKSPHNEHNISFTSTKGLLNGPGQNNCFLNSAVQDGQNNTEGSKASSWRHVTDPHLTRSSRRILASRLAVQDSARYTTARGVRQETAVSSSFTWHRCLVGSIDLTKQNDAILFSASVPDCLNFLSEKIWVKKSALQIFN